MEGLDLNKNLSFVAPDEDFLLQSSTIIADTTGAVSIPTLRNRPSDAWIGPAILSIVLLMLACITAGFIYSKFRRWKAEVVSDLTENGQPDLERRPSKEEFPPSYLVVTGLPSYDQAVQFARKASVCRGNRLRGSATSTPILAPIVQCGADPESLSSEGNSSDVRGVYPNPPLSPPNQRHSMAVSSTQLPPPGPSTSSNSFYLNLESDVEIKSPLVKLQAVTIDVENPLVSILP